MRRYMLLIAFVAAASTIAVLISGLQDADERAEEAEEDSMISCLGV